MPNRSASHLGAEDAAISRAQHAIPKCRGKIEFLKDQFQIGVVILSTALFTPVARMRSSKSSEDHLTNSLTLIAIALGARLRSK